MPTPAGGYRNKAGKRVPSVTTINSRFMDSAALKNWYFTMGQENPQLRNAYDLPKDAVNIGSVAHKMVEMHINGVDCKAINLYCEDALLDQGNIELARSSYSAYLGWALNFKVKFIAQEVEMVSEKYQYGGTPDAIGFANYRDGSALCLFDWKTSAGVYEDYLLQLSAYKNLWNENHPDNPITGPCHLLRFSKIGGDFTHHCYENLDMEFQQFISFVECYRRSQQIKKRAA